MTIPRRFLALLLLAGLSAAASVRAGDTDALAERACGVLRTYCWKCHGRQGEPVQGDLRVFDREQLVQQRKVVRPSRPEDSELYQLVACGSMPPGDLPKLGPDDVAALRDWIVEGAPNFQHGDAYVVNKIREDLLTLNPQTELPRARYISFNHLLTDDPAAPDLDLWRDALVKALNHLTWKPDPVPVTPIDPAGSIFRVDEGKLGWELQPFDATDPRYKNVDLFDLVLLEYPYATAPGRFGGDQKILADYLLRAGPVRPILYMRGDWFVSTATQPPLYEDLLRLPRVLVGNDGLEKKIQASGAPGRAGFLHSKMSGGPQLVERRADVGGPAGPGAYWRTFDPGTAKDMKSLVRLPSADRGGLMLFTLPNGLNGYYIAESVPNEDEKGKPLPPLVRLATTAPVQWVMDPNAPPDRIARNGLSCMRCHESGVETFADAANAVLDDLSPAEKKLFPGKEAIDKLVAGDADRFRNAVAVIHGGPLDREPLTPITTRFRQKVQAEAVAPEAQVAGIGNMGTPVGGAEPVHFMAPDLDAPLLPPLDGLTQAAADYEPLLSTLPAQVDFKSFKVLANGTKQESLTFAKGENFMMEITNRGQKPVFIELIGAYMDGHMTIHQPPISLGPGKTYSYPHDLPGLKPPLPDFFPMSLPPGVDRYILFAADAKFPEGVLLHSAREPNITDRVVHPFWSDVNFDPSHFFKKTLPIETVAP